MSKDKGKVIDYLSEDPEISGQRYALVSIVGPHMPQKCDVWGLKVRGVADSVIEAKQMTKKLMKIDNMYDIYTVSVGKFFPLNVEPYDVKEVEHSDEQLNELMKNYLKNREDANAHYHQRKQMMMEKAIREGKEGQAELASRPEHPIAVLQRKQNFEEKAKELKEQLESLEKDLQLTSEKYITYTEEERLQAEEEVRKAIENQEKTNQKMVDEHSFDNIKDEIANELKEELVSQHQERPEEINPLKSILDELSRIENEIKESYDTLNEINKTDSPNVFERVSNKLNTLEVKRDDLKLKLNDKKLVNEYINKGFKGDSPHDTLFH